MQIRRLRIDDHRCLVDFDINFNINEDGGSSTILIGENGTGKSTMIQTILEILISFDSDAVAKKINYQYELEYFYKGSNIIIQQSERHYVIYIDGELFSSGALDTVKKHLAKAEKSLFPERISYFYSGQNNSALYSIRRVENKHNQVCRGLLAKYWNALYLQNRTYEGDFPKEKYNHCTEKLVPVYLLSILCGQESREKELLCEQCRFSGIETVSIALSVDRISGRLQNDVVEVGNEGVCDLVSFIDDRFTDLFRTGFLYQDYDQFFYEIRNIAEVDADSIAIFNFFEKMETLLDAEIEVTVKVGEAPVLSRYLSEGQRQLIKVLGMLGVCKSEDALVLMDEPDAHMNPKWKYELKTIIDDCLSVGEVTNTQAIIATHDPLVINGVLKEYIRIFEYNEAVRQHNGFNTTRVIEPTEDTTGMGIDGLLQSEYYRLRTSYDKMATKKFVRRQELYEKLINKEISTEEKEELRALTKEIASMQMSNNSIDFLYDDFIRVFRRTEYYKKEYMSFDEMQDRRRKIEEIIRALYEGQV